MNEDVARILGRDGGRAVTESRSRRDGQPRGFDVSANCTVSGDFPEAGVAVKLGIGAGQGLRSDGDDLRGLVHPASLATVSVTV